MQALAGHLGVEGAVTELVAFDVTEAALHVLKLIDQHFKLTGLDGGPKTGRLDELVRCHFVSLVIPGGSNSFCVGVDYSFKEKLEAVLVGEDLTYGRVLRDLWLR